MPRIDLEHVSRAYALRGASVTALHDVTVSIEDGEAVAVMGPSGSGKSTLLHALSGLDAVDSGSVRIDGTEIATLTDPARAMLRNKKIGFVFQDFHLLPALTALENVALPLRLRRPRLRTATTRKRALRALDDVGLADRAHHRPSELSGGEQQRVAIARALVTWPSLLIADEPTGNLDTKTGAMILKLLRSLQTTHGATLVLATHDEAVAAACDRILRMRDGRLLVS